MKVLVACEYSGTVRDAFLSRGHDAISCDILPTEAPGPHYQGSALDLLGEEWDLVIAHPPCTYLANSGVQYLYHRDGAPNTERWESLRDGAAFFAMMFDFRSPRIAVENPVQHRYAKQLHGMGDQSQRIQPWQYGHTESKGTCLWLRGLPPLQPTDIVYDEMMKLPIKERQKCWWASPGKGASRAHIRSKTYQGIAAAMADQWGNEGIT